VLVITIEPRQGNFAPWWKQIHVLVHDRSPAEAIASTTVRVLKSERPATEALEFEIADAPAGGRIVVGP
jgi:hypothetical protein